MGNVIEIKRGKFSGEIPNNRVRPAPSVQSSETWQFGLGMHNFRALLRSGDSKSRLVTGVSKKSVDITGLCRRRKKTINRRRLNRHKQRFVRSSGKFPKRWDSNYGKIMVPLVNVKKSIDVDRGYNEACGMLRKIPIQRDGRYWRYLAKLSKSKLRLRSGDGRWLNGKIMASTNLKFSDDRWGRRRKWLYKESYLKLPHQFVNHMGDKGFVSYCVFVRCVGIKTAFFLNNSWRSAAGKKVAAICKKIQKETELKNAKFAVPPRPVRQTYKNFKDWRISLELWQKTNGYKDVCRGCYKTAYSEEFDEDRCHWKNDNFYNIKYDKDRNGKPIVCMVCGSF
jgi:hypothetical protein